MFFFVVRIALIFKICFNGIILSTVSILLFHLLAGDTSKQHCISFPKCVPVSFQGSLSGTLPYNPFSSVNKPQTYLQKFHFISMELSSLGYSPWLVLLSTSTKAFLHNFVRFLLGSPSCSNLVELFLLVTQWVVVMNIFFFFSFGSLFIWYAVIWGLT